jgi:hypothetical protein
MNLLSFEEIKAKGIKKGDHIVFINQKNGELRKGKVEGVRTKTISGGKYFCRAKNRWVESEKVKQLYFLMKLDEYNFLFGEDSFYMIEKAKK